jgi:hypothetical protein
MSLFIQPICRQGESGTTASVSVPSCYCSRDVRPSPGWICALWTLWTLWTLLPAVNARSRPLIWPGTASASPRRLEKRQEGRMRAPYLQTRCFETLQPPKHQYQCSAAIHPHAVRDQIPETFGGASARPSLVSILPSTAHLRPTICPPDSFAHTSRKESIDDRRRCVSHSSSLSSPSWP